MGAQKADAVSRPGQDPELDKYSGWTKHADHLRSRTLGQVRNSQAALLGLSEMAKLGIWVFPTQPEATASSPAECEGDNCLRLLVSL